MVSWNYGKRLQRLDATAENFKRWFVNNHLFDVFRVRHICIAVVFNSALRVDADFS